MENLRQIVREANQIRGDLAEIGGKIQRLIKTAQTEIADASKSQTNNRDDS